MWKMRLQKVYNEHHHVYIKKKKKKKKEKLYNTGIKSKKDLTRREDGFRARRNGKELIVLVKNKKILIILDQIKHLLFQLE